MNRDKIPEYIFSKLTKRVVEIERRIGRKVLNLGPGSPDVPPSQIYIDKLAEFIREPRAHLYPGYQATPEFSTGLQNWYQKRFGVMIENDEILPLLGAKDGVSHLPLLWEKGDEILTPDPGYPAYIGPAILAGIKPVTYDLGGDPKKFLTSKTRAIWVNFPNNPTGTIATLEELKALVNLCKTNNLLLIYDNAYSEITFDGYIAPSILQVPGAKEVAIELGSFSKTYSLAGYRMGWVVGNKEVIAQLAKIKSQIDSGLSLPLQKLGDYVLENPDLSWYKGMIENYRKRREIIAIKLNKLGLNFDLPKASLYIWAKIPNNFKNSEEFSQWLLQEKQILVTPGSAFGKNGLQYIRASICSNIERIDEYV